MLPGREEPAPSPGCPPALRDCPVCPASGPAVVLWGAHGAEAAPLPMAGPTPSPTGRGGRPWAHLAYGKQLRQPQSSWHRAGKGRPGERGRGSRRWGTERGSGVGAGPDWDRLRYRGAFVWGFMACEAVLPARQEAPIGTRLARGAQGRGQEEGEGGDSTALLRLQHHFGLMAAPGPLKPHARPCVILAVLTRGWHQPWMENAAGSGHALRALQQHLTPPCPRARTAGVTFHTQLLGSGGNTCPRGLLSMTYIPWGPGEPTLGASLVQRNMLPRARVMYFAGGGPGHGFPSVPEQLLPR